MYGKELILDLYGCDPKMFTRESIKKWLEELCKLINMEREDLHFWDYTDVREDKIPYDQPHLVGTSAVQFITTSDIVIHTLDILEECYINIFSCKEFDEKKAADFTGSWFKAKTYEANIVKRGKQSKCQMEGEMEDEDCIDCHLHGKCSGPQWNHQLCPN